MTHSWDNRHRNIAAHSVEDLRELLRKKQFVLAANEDLCGLFDGPDVCPVVAMGVEVLLQPERIRGGRGLDAARYREGQHGQTVKMMNAEEIEDGEANDPLYGDAIPGVVLRIGLPPGEAERTVGAL